MTLNCTSSDLTHSFPMTPELMLLNLERQRVCSHTLPFRAFASFPQKRPRCLSPDIYRVRNVLNAILHKFTAKTCLHPFSHNIHKQILHTDLHTFLTKLVQRTLNCPSEVLDCCFKKVKSRIQAFAHQRHHQGWENQLRGFDKRSKHFPFCDYYVNSDNLFSWLCSDTVRRKLVLVTLG